MNIKRIIISGSLTFAFACIFHFLYELVPNFIFSIFFPVNESIFEHLKLIFTSSLVSSLILSFFYKEKNNFFILYLKAIFNIFLLLILYLPLRYIFGEILVITLIVLFISNIGSEVFLQLLLKDDFVSLNKFGIVLIIITYFIFTYFTYFPLKKFLFYDIMHNRYGI